MPAAAGLFECSRRSSSVSHSLASGSARSNATCITVVARKATHGEGPVLYTGPSGVRDFRSHLATDNRMVGIGRTSVEATGDLGYIWRGAPGSPHPTSRRRWAGEIGWLIPPFVDYRNVNSGKQIKMGDFRQAQENKHTHRFQEPWYPSPNHPDYPKMFRHTNYYRTHTANPYIPQSYQSTHTCRPHTVAFHAPTHYESFPSLSDRGSRPHSTTGSDRSAIVNDQNPIQRNAGSSGYDSPNGVHSLHSSHSSTDRQTRLQSHESFDQRGSTASSRNSQQSLKRFRRAPSATQTSGYSGASYRSPPGKPDY